MRENNCGSCEFFDVRVNGDIRGECKRFPPTQLLNPLGDDYTSFPSVRDWEWCGEHKPKERGSEGK